MSSSSFDTPSFPSLLPYGFGDRWRALAAEHPDAVPARVLRHDGRSYLLATPDGVASARHRPHLEPRPTVGDWVACRCGDVVAVLPRASLLRRRDAAGGREQALAANVDRVLLVCGVDRPVSPGRIDRGATLAWDAGATPALVLTKACLLGADERDDLVARLRSEHPALDVAVTSAHEDVGLGTVRALVGSGTAVMLGESGAGKSSLLNALLDGRVADAAVGSVRDGDAKGRHTTTSRELRPLPSGGVLIDSPGIREVGLWVDPDAVDRAFDAIDELSAGCRFGDCAHDGEPGCAVVAAVDGGELDADRLRSWRRLRHEAESAARRADAHQQRAHDRRFGRVVKDAQRRKGR